MTRFGMGVTFLGIMIIAVLGYLFFIIPKSPAQQVPVNVSAGDSENPAPLIPGDGTSTPPTTSGETSKPQVSGGCYIGGCSGEICSDRNDMVSNCLYQEEFACYKTAKCERQTTGKCGWTPTTSLKECINNANSGAASGFLSGKVTIGPFCPVERADKPCPPPEGAYTSREAVVYKSDGTEKERTHLDADGNYKFILDPGNYYVQIEPAGIGPGEKKPTNIKSYGSSIVNFDIDTGIR